MTRSTALVVCAFLFCFAAASVNAEQRPPLVLRSESFDREGAWQGFRNRLLPTPLPVTRQDFGYRASHRAGGRAAGEIGGLVERSSEPAMYARAIVPRTLDQRLSASGRLVVPMAGGGSGVLVGWFHESSRGWRTPNSLAFRVDGNGGKYWMFYEYGTRNYRTGGGGAFAGEQYQKTPTPPFQAGDTVHTWSLDYDPAAADGRGLLTFRVDDRSYQTALAPGHRTDGAEFNRFGIFNQQTPGDQLELYLDDLVIDGEPQSFDDDPAWQGVGNRMEFAERVIRPHHDFGHSHTAHCGSAAGEIGGIIFRDERPASYGTTTGALSLDDELRASGKLVLNRAGSDSGVYIGWFNRADKERNETPEHIARQRNYLGILVEGPSRVGHFFRPSYATATGAGITASGEGSQGQLVWPVIRPDGRIHEWSLHYRPEAASGRGQIELSLDGESHSLELAPGHRAAGAAFDQFGIFNAQSGGHHVEIYLDDVTYSAR
ncbi:MAG: hypothetical protein AB7O59_14690 [Pirellulales bacterium]